MRARLVAVSLRALTVSLLCGSSMASEIVVTSDPSGAAVWLDGQNVGQSPLQLPYVAPGQHRVRVELERYMAYERSVSVGNTGAVEVHAHLVPGGSRERPVSLELAASLRPGMGISERWYEGPETRIKDPLGLTGVLDGQYRGTPAGFGPTIAVRTRLSRSLALDLSAESFSRTLTNSISISESNAWVKSGPSYNVKIYSTTYAGTVGPLAHRQRMVHVGLVWRRRVGPRADLDLSVGPSLFRVEQDVMSSLHLHLADCRPIPEANNGPDYALSGCTFSGVVEREGATRLGGHVGAALAMRVARRVSVVAGLRVASALAVKLPGIDMRACASLLPLSPYEQPDRWDRPFDPAEPQSTVRVNTTVIAPRIGLRYTF
jgi:hypothetical protein